MKYMVQSRPDGQAEIMEITPVRIGIIADPAVACRIVDLLNAAPQAGATVPAAIADKAEEPGDEAPLAPVFVRAEPVTLPQERRETALKRLTAGEEPAAVALDLGVSVSQLRGIWARHRRELQRFYASGGQETCKLCARLFTPSVSNPDTCARCSHAG